MPTVEREPSATANPEPRRKDATRERILDTAGRVFAENGYTRATTRALAAAAGITEVTLFRHFGSKEKLFAAMVERYGGQAVVAVLEAQLSGDYRTDLLRIGQTFLTILMQRREVVRLMLCEAGHFPELAETLSQNPRLLREMLARYLQQQIDQGCIRPLNVEAAAQAFWGMFFAYAVILDVYHEPPSLGVSPQEVAAHFVDVFVNGIIRQE
jgi:AcrR family transcriptional regulator